MSAVKVLYDANPALGLGGAKAWVDRNYPLPKAVGVEVAAAKPKAKAKHPTGYDKDQHELICKAIGTSPDPDAPGLMAYEGVCILLTKLYNAKHTLRRATRLLAGRDRNPASDSMVVREARAMLRYLGRDPEKFTVIEMHGAGE